MIYRPKHFRLEELVDRRTFQQFGERAWFFFSPFFLFSLDGIREFFDAPVTANDWVFGGEFQFRVFRPSWYTGGADYSFHRLALAADVDISGVTAEEARERIIESKNDNRLKYITRLEGGVDWLHLDLAFIPVDDRIIIFNP